MSTRDIIAKNIALMLNDGDFVNLGVGIPTLVGKYIPEGVSVVLHGENGSAGLGAELEFEGIFDDAETLKNWQTAHKGITEDGMLAHKDLTNAGSNYTRLLPGASCFDSLTSFAIARGGHLDATVLGGMQVDEQGNLANWMIPGKRQGGMGGAMDLVAGTKRVIIAMEHADRFGEPKIVRECTLPLTGMRCVTDIVTELCVISVTEGGLVVEAMAPGITREELQEKTGAKLTFAENVKTMEV